MKSPSDLSLLLARYWDQPSIRLKKLLNPAAWPMTLRIGKPTANSFNAQIAAVQRHVEAWREVEIGEVKWTRIAFRSGAESIDLPTMWCLRNPSEWVAAASSSRVNVEYAELCQIVSVTPSSLRQLLIGRRRLWKGKPMEEVIQAALLATRLFPGCAGGMPLRLMSGYGVDTKFFERHELLLRRMLDVLYEGEASVQGLCGFLDAYDDTSHWVLVTPLDRDLLAFRRQLVTTSELAVTDLPGSRLLVVENKSCLHLLDELPGTIAILGCGSDLAWLASCHLNDKTVGYWGDLDTWGLRMLARAREKNAKVDPLLMTEDVYDRHQLNSAVPEPVRAQETPPAGLTSSEAALYMRLVESAKGRLEQEFIPGEEVKAALRAWLMS